LEELLERSRKLIADAEKAILAAETLLSSDKGRHVNPIIRKMLEDALAPVKTAVERLEAALETIDSE